MTADPQYAEIDHNLPLAQGLVFSSLGRFAGGTRLFDSSLRRNHVPLVNGPTWVGNSRGTGRVLSLTAASSQYGTSSTAPVTAAPCSIAAWFVVNATSVTHGIAGMHRASGGDAWIGLQTVSTTNQVAARVYDGTTSVSAYGTAPLVAGRWTHAVAVFESSSRRLCYINGVAGTAETTSVTPTVNQFDVGRIFWAGLGYYLDGKLGSVCVWNRALSAGEVRSLYSDQFALLRRPRRTLYVPVMALTDNLVAYWKLDEASGSRVDSVASISLAETGTGGVGSATGKLGNAADFEFADGDYLSVADNATLSMADIDFSIQAWVNLESKSNVMGIVLKETSPTNREYRIDYEPSSDKFRFFAFKSDMSVAGGVSGSTTPINTGTWYHIIAYHDAAANVVGMAINAGTAVTASTGVNVPYDGTAAFKIGGGDGSGLLTFDGLIDEVGVWKRVLTSGERTSLYNSGNGLAYPFTTTGSGRIISGGGLLQGGILMGGRLVA